MLAGMISNLYTRMLNSHSDTNRFEQSLALIAVNARLASYQHGLETCTNAANVQSCLSTACLPHCFPKLSCQ